LYIVSGGLKSIRVSINLLFIQGKRALLKEKRGDLREKRGQKGSFLKFM
jgi:hypothetical protein